MYDCQRGERFTSIYYYRALCFLTKPVEDLIVYDFLKKCTNVSAGLAVCTTSYHLPIYFVSYLSISGVYTCTAMAMDPTTGQ